MKVYESNECGRLGICQRIPTSAKDADDALLSYESLEQLRELAAVYRKSGKYNEAYQLYHTISGQMEGCFKIQPSINKTICLLETDQMKLARHEVREIVRVVNASVADENLYDIFQMLDGQLRDLAERFIESHECDPAILLARCRFEIIKALQQDSLTRLLSLEKIGLVLQNISEEMALLPKRPKTKCSYNCLCCLMDEILDEMQRVSEVDIRMKSSRVAWFLKYIGFCSDELEDYQRSLLAYNQAITIMKTVFGAEATYYKVLGFCYNNLAYVYEHTSQLKEAMKALRFAVDIFHDAIDWSSDEDKSKCIAKTLATLHAVKEKCTPHKSNHHTAE